MNQNIVKFIEIYDLNKDICKNIDIKVFSELLKIDRNNVRDIIMTKLNISILKAIIIEKAMIEKSIILINIKNLDPDTFVNIYYDLTNKTISSLKDNEKLIKKIKSSSQLALMSDEALNPKSWEAYNKKCELRYKVMTEIETTNLYECPRCNARQCLYSSAQIRGNDEPETVRLKCVPCGNEWQIT